MTLSFNPQSSAWLFVRTLGFWGIGLLNTVFREPGAEPDWRFAVGLAVLVLALLDTGLFVRRLLKRQNPKG